MALPILVQYCQNRADTDTSTASIDIMYIEHEFFKQKGFNPACKCDS